jgi:hypothetical protein
MCPPTNARGGGGEGWLTAAASPPPRLGSEAPDRAEALGSVDHGDR